MAESYDCRWCDRSFSKPYNLLIHEVTYYYYILSYDAKCESNHNFPPEVPRIRPSPLQYLWKGISQQGEHEVPQVS